jgi:O-antigen ligase
MEPPASPVGAQPPVETEDPAPAQAPAAGSGGAVGNLVSGSPAFIPGMLLVGVFLAWAWYQAGEAPTAWYPGALFALALLAVLAFAVRQPRRAVPRPLLLGIVCFGGYTAWSYASIAWAGVPEDAWTGANRTLLYLTVFCLFAPFPWSPRAAAVLLSTYAVGIAAIMLAVLAQATTSADPLVHFWLGRYESPADYPNANAALALMPVWPALYLASQRRVPWLGRALLLGSVAALVEIALLGQSRGALLAFPVVLVVYFALVPDRLRSLVSVVLVGAVVGPSVPVLLHLYAVRDSPIEVGAALDDAFVAVCRSAAIAAVLGAAAAVVDRRLELAEETLRRIRIGVAIGVAAVLVAGIAGAVARVGNPIDRIERAWNSFTDTDTIGVGGETIRTGLEGSRYDIWRVALKEFSDSPVIGVGDDNFQVDYLQDRRTPESPRYPHSLELRILSQGGIIGLLLFVGFLAGSLSAAWKARARADRFAAGLAACAVTAFAYWFVHGSVDWFWEFAGLGAPAFAFLGLACGLAPREEAGERSASSRGLAVAGVAAGILVVLVCAVSLMLPWLSAREVAAAATQWRTDPQGALERLDRARSLNFLSHRPDLAAGAIASEIGDVRLAREAYSRALERNPDSWVALVQLGLIAQAVGDHAEARDLVQRALELNPRERSVLAAAEIVRSGEPGPYASGARATSS